MEWGGAVFAAGEGADFFVDIVAGEVEGTGRKIGDRRNNPHLITRTRA